VQCQRKMIESEALWPITDHRCSNYVLINISHTLLSIMQALQHQLNNMPTSIHT